MDSLLPILVAAVVALLGFVAAQVVATLVNAEKRKLKQRLSGEGRQWGDGESASGLPRSIVQQTEPTGASATLVRLPGMAAMHRHLMQAYPDASLARFVGLGAALFFAAGMLTLAVIGSPVTALTAGALAAAVPVLAVGNRRNRRQKALSLQVPEALDFLSRVLRAGHSFSTALQMMGTELPQPIAAEFGRCYDQHSLGQPLEDCLKDAAARVESTDFAFFVTAVLIQRQTGGDLSEVLKNISGMIRQRIRLQQHVKAKTAEGRFTGYILVAFPAVMFVLVSFLNPDYARVLTGTDTGVKLLGLAFVLQVLGLVSIRKLTTVKV